VADFFGNGWPIISRMAGRFFRAQTEWSIIDNDKEIKQEY